MLELHRRNKTWHVGGRNAAGCDIPRHTTGCTTKEAAEQYKRGIDHLTVWNGWKAYRAALVAPKAGANTVTLTDALNEWLECLKSGGEEGGEEGIKTHAESTLRSYEVSLRTQLIDQLPDITLVSQLTGAHLQKIQNGWRERLNPGSIRTYRIHFNTFLKFCVKKKYLTANPLAEVAPLKKTKMRFEDKIEGKIKNANGTATMPLDLGMEPTNWLLIRESIVPYLRRQLTHLGQKPRQREGFRNQYRLEPEAFLAYLELMYFTGLRRSDALFFRPGNITDTPSGNGMYVTHQIKTEDLVTIFIQPWLVNKLRALPRLDPKGLYCFYDKSHKSWENYLNDVIGKPLREFGKLVGIEELRPHRFRDSFAVNALNAGMSIEWLARALGHKRIRTTETYYMPFVRSRQERHEKAWILMLAA